MRLGNLERAGCVLSAATQLAVQDVRVEASALARGRPRTLSSGYTDSSAAFSIPALPPSTYSLSTGNNSALIDEVYPNVACPGTCSPLLPSHLSVPVAQYATTSGRDFSLDLAGSIMGVATDGRTGGPLPSAFVNVYTRVAGEVVTVAQARPDAAGIYAVPKLSAATEWAVAFAAERLGAQVFENIPCPDTECGASFAATGTPIVVEPLTPYTGVNFSLVPASNAWISGRRLNVTWSDTPLGERRPITWWRSARGGTRECRGAPREPAILLLRAGARRFLLPARAGAPWCEPRAPAREMMVRAGNGPSPLEPPLSLTTPRQLLRAFARDQRGRRRSAKL
jgi:hypothetical protein